MQLQIQTQNQNRSFFIGRNSLLCSKTISYNTLFTALWESSKVPKADDLIFLSLVMLQQGFRSSPTEAPQRGLEGLSGHRPTEYGALAEVQLVQDAFLGQIEKELPMALQVKGGTPTCWTWTISFEVHYCG